MENNKFKTGAIPSIPDDRDYQLDQYISCVSHLPNSFVSNIPFDIFDQGDSNECVACSLALIRYIQEYNQSNNRNQFSPSYIYGNRDDDMYLGEGMSPREALKIVKNYGVALYKELPGFYSVEDAMEICKKHLQTLNESAYQFRISSYYSVSGISGIKNAVYKLNAVTAMFPVFDCLNDAESDGKVKYSLETSRINYGNHQMTIIGWTENKEWIVANSWGKSYGDNGIIYIPFEYPIIESWAIVDNILEKKFILS